MTEEKGVRPRLKRLAAEALAIFVGVGAALGGQSWFEWRLDRATEDDLLTNVLAEVRANEARLNGGLEDLRQNRMSLQAVSVFLAEEATPADSDSIEVLAWNLIRSGGPGVVTFALDEALHDVPNVFVTDGACITSAACQNPWLTYMAL